MNSLFLQKSSSSRSFPIKLVYLVKYSSHRRSFSSILAPYLLSQERFTHPRRLSSTSGSFVVNYHSFPSQVKSFPIVFQHKQCQYFSTIPPDTALQTSENFIDLLTPPLHPQSVNVIELIQSGSLNIDIHLHDQLANPYLSIEELNHIIEAISYSDVGLKVLNDSLFLSKITTINLEKLLNLTILTDSWNHAHSIAKELVSRNDPASKPYHFLQYILSMKKSNSYSYITEWCDIHNIHKLFQLYSHNNTTIQEVFDMIISSWLNVKGPHLLINLASFLKLIDQYKVYPHPLSSNELMSRVLKTLSENSDEIVTLNSESVNLRTLLSDYYQSSFSHLHQNLLFNIDNNSSFNYYQKYISTISYIPNNYPQSIEMKSEQSYLLQLLKVYDHEIQPKRNLLYLKRDVIRLLASFQPRKAYISPHLPVIFEFSKIFLHDSRYSRYVQDTVDFCLKLIELFVGKVPTQMNWIERRSATAAALFESVDSETPSHLPFETFGNRKLELMDSITKVFEKSIKREQNYSKARQKHKQRDPFLADIGRDLDQMRSTYYGHLIRAICSDNDDYLMNWNRLINTLGEISPTLKYSGGQVGGGCMYSYCAIGGMYACQYHLSGSRQFEFTNSISLFTPLSRISNNDISMNHLILDMTQYLNDEFETACIRNTLTGIHAYLSQIDHPEALYTQLLLQIQHQTILNTISDLQQYGYYTVPIGTEVTFDAIMDRIFCLSFENDERNELLSNITDDIFQQYLMKKLLFRVNIFLKILKSDYGLDINNLYDVNKYVDGLNSSLGKKGSSRRQKKTSIGSNLSQNSLPYQSPHERCMFQVYKYILQILTQVGHPVGCKVVTKYLMELSNHSNADIPSKVFSKVIKMNTLAKKYIDIHELTKIMILRNRSLYVDDIFHVITSFLVTKDYPTAYKIILYAVKQMIIPPPHIFCSLCVTIGTSPILQERSLNIAEKTFQLMLKIYGPHIVYSSYWSSLQDGCLLSSRIKWLLKLKKYGEIRDFMKECEHQLMETPQRLIVLCEICLTLLPSQETEIIQEIEKILSHGKESLQHSTLASPTSPALLAYPSTISPLQHSSSFSGR